MTTNDPTRLRALHTFVLCLAMIVFGPKTQADEFVSPEILVLGDSQLTFGSGPAFLEFFSDIKAHCGPTPRQARDLKHLGEMRVGVIGVRSTSIHSWVARDGHSKDAICEEDKKWRVNAGTYGFINMTDNTYVQIGKGKEYQFCAPNRSAFEEMFRDAYYDPKLFLMTFLGNSAKRWANSVDAAKKDVTRMMSQLPEDLPCVFLTTQPAYKKKTTELRLKAQENLRTAFEETGARCSFVPGVTPETMAANHGNKQFFRLNKNGMVKDPFHPNAKAAKNFFALEMDAICEAVFEQLGAGE